MAGNQKKLLCLCLRGCRHLVEEPLDAEDRKAGIKPLWNCDQGNFELRERADLPVFDVAGKQTCEGYDRTRRNPTPEPYVNLAEVLPPEAMEAVWRATDGGGVKAYIPRRKREQSRVLRYFQAFVDTGSVQAAARSEGVSVTQIEGAIAFVNRDRKKKRRDRPADLEPTPQMALFGHA